ncbi:phage head protein DarA [Salmonella enterica subsp. enterica serovar Paratyphi A]|nr:phage head protein DarA [Salmonella enterica subsp. enterica serovar Paratyphi A]
MEQFNINKGVTIKPGLDVLPPPVTDDEYRALMAGEDRYLMTESNTLEEIEATFFYDTPIHWCATDLLEAISSTRLQLHRTMQAFVRALNHKLNGTGISAGSDKTGDVAQSGAREIGGAEIGRARNVNGLPVLPAIIPLSDGQTISILFHSPTAENRITNSDTLVAFQFLLNKKDVTHTVAPMSGRDMTLAQVTMKLANLAEKNSAKFQRAQKKKKALVDEITQLQADSDQKEDAMSDLADQVAAVEGQKADLEQKINAVASEADSLYQENERLQAEIDQLNRTGGRDTIAPAGMTGGHSRALTDRLASIKNRMHMDGEATLSNGASMKQFIGDGEGYIQLTDPDGSVYMIKAKSIQGVDMADAIGKLFKAYKAGDVSEYLVQPEVSVGAYRYALQMRPAAPGAIPEGNKAILPRPDEGDPYYEYARYGIATYDTPLSDQQMSEYDLKLLPREDSFDFLAKTLTNGPFGKYAQKALELATSSPDEFRVMLKTQFQKTFPNIAFPGGAGTEKMVQSMINALQAEVGEITQPEPAPAQPDETVSEADAEANKAIEYLNNVMDMQSTDMAEIRNARGNVREAIAALQAAGRFEENEELVNGAARHLADLLVAIQKAGVAA